MKDIELLVEGIYKTEGGETFVIGGENNFKELRLGARFLQKYEYEYGPYDVTRKTRERTAINIAAVDLVVTKIIVRDKEFDFLSPGWTGMLSLSGTGFEHVKNRCLLSTRKL